ncbi:hypothetical protein RJ639_013359 [Escallonia herrerae]|uniref:Phosphofructokinase domain-containing protein n=1 Tax=Escallonia herrerae TaxID=1293975 RepID=A0AA88VFI8_9ASTE|nr:hypothetical protein RJ639_013359 [Escallonia herrerae]
MADSSSTGIPHLDTTDTAAAEHENELNSFSLPPVTLQKLPHLTDYLQNLQTSTNPLENSLFYRPSDGFYLTRNDVVLRQITFDLSLTDFASPLLAYHRADPRKEVYFRPGGHVRAAIVTCGGLCPGMNTVIRELVVGLWELYGVRDIFGVKSGYRGFYSGEAAVRIDPKMVHNWHRRGGTLLETSRGGFDLDKIVNAIQDRGFNQCLHILLFLALTGKWMSAYNEQVYIIGGDGTMRGAVEIFNESRCRKLEIAVTGIPKTVDNDVGIFDRSFGFHTAVEMAQQAISA